MKKIDITEDVFAQLISKDWSVGHLPVRDGDGYSYAESRQSRSGAAGQRWSWERTSFAARTL